MRIFLAHASSDTHAADGMAIGLRQQGHTVFFDADDLPPGGNYDERIKQAIEDSDLFLFVVSPQSVAEGRFTRSELKFAREKWPNPTDRVLPVMVEPTPRAKIPPYLGRVTIYEPEGDVVTEVLSQVERLDKRRKRWRLPAVAGGAVLLAAAGAAAFFWWPSSNLPVVELLPPKLIAKGLLGRGDQYLVDANFKSGGSKQIEITGVSLQLTNKRQLTGGVDWSPLPINWSVPLVIEPKGAASLSSSVAFSDAAGKPIAGQLPPTDWKLCYVVADTQTCTPPQPWAATADEAVDRILSASEDFRRSATAVLARGTELFIVAAKPGRIFRVWDTQGGLQQQGIEGEPVDITLGIFSAGNFSGTALYVATRAPDTVIVFNPENLKSLARFPIDLSRAKQDIGQPTLSTQPRQLAVDGSGTVWLLTGGGTGEAGLARLAPDGRWSIPPYFSDLAFNLKDLRLRSLGGRIWAAETATTPSSIYLLDAENFTTFGGHSFDVVSCAKDLVSGSHGGVVVRDCDGRLVEVANQEQKLSFLEDFGKGPSLDDGPGFWTVENLQRPITPMIVGAYNIYETRAGSAVPSQTIFAASPENSAASTLLSVDRAETLDMASTPNRALLLLQGEDGNREAVFVRVNGLL